MANESDSSYDFDAPMFVDFTNKEVFDQDGIDKWFDGKIGDDGGFLIESPEKLSNDQVKDNEHTLPNENEQEAPAQSCQETETENKAPTNEPTSEQSKEEKSDEKNTQPWFFFEDKSAPNLTVMPSWKPRLQALKRIVATSATDTDEPPNKKKRSESTRSQVNTSIKSTSGNVPRRSLRSSSKSVANTSLDGRRPVRGKQVPKIKASMLTIPSTPTMLRRSKNHPQPKAAMKPKEELELEKIAKMQKDLKEKRKQNEEFMKKALSAAQYMPHRSAEDNLTHAHEFHFELDKRIKKPQVNPTEGKEKNFFETLRQHPPSPSFKNRKLTKQQPFSFDNNSSKKRKMMDEEVSSCNGYVSMAQQCYKFQNSTPPRFRTKNDKEHNTDAVKGADHGKSKLTCPKTPNLSTRERKRALPDDCLSREQQEEKELEEMRSYKFKAREFDHKIVEKQGAYGLKPQPHKNLTEFKPFKLATDERSVVSKAKETDIEEKPAPFKAQPVPEFEKTFKPELNHQHTKQAPFSFDQRDKETIVKKEVKIQAILEEEKKAREFHAQPLQSFSPMELSSMSKPNTKFEPFNLQTENRGARKAEQWAKKVEEDLLDQRKKIAFKAHSSNVLYQAPFVPKKSLKPSTVFEEFNLHSERRAEERAVYEMHKKEKDLQDEELIRQREAEQEEEERQNLALLRKQLVHKANPIRTYKEVNITGSDKPLTLPESPSWHIRESKSKMFRI